MVIQLLLRQALLVAVMLLWLMESQCDKDSKLSLFVIQLGGVNISRLLWSFNRDLLGKLFSPVLILE